MRQLVTVTAILRWVGLVAGGLIGVVAPPKALPALVVLILGVGVYNTWSMLAVRRADDAAVLRIARTVTLFDEIGCLVFLAIFSELPGGSQIAFYVPILIEAMAFDGRDGVIAGVVLFVLGITAIRGAGAAFFHRPFAWDVVLVWSLIMVVVGAALVAVDQITFSLEPASSRGGANEPLPGPEAEGLPVRLSPREQEVLRLIAAGYSNAMIARKLNLSETTIKTYVQTLLTRLSVRNRAEAVATASRLRLL